MKYSFVLIATTTAATPVLAHPGHLAGLAGHDHWVAGAAIGAAIAYGLWQGLKGKQKPQSDLETDDTPQEA